MDELLLLCGFAFFAGLVDAVAGGGGLTQVPALFALFPAAEPAMLLGTNKVSSIAGTAAAVVRYARNVPIPSRSLRSAAIGAALGSVLGAWSISYLPAEAVRGVVVLLLVLVGGYVWIHGRFGLARQGHSQAWPGGQVAYCTGLGFYDGFLGPGTGSFLIFGLVRWFRHDFLEAASYAKVINLTTNAGALGYFAAAGKVDLGIGIPMAVANLVGGYLGASAAVRRGAPFIRKVFLLVTAALIAKMALDLSD